MLRGELLRRHLAIAVELRALVQHQAWRAYRALHSRRRHQLDAFPRRHFAAERARDRYLARGNPRTHHRAGRDYNFISGDLAFRFAFDFYRAAKVEFPRSLGAFSYPGLESRFFVERHIPIAFPGLGFHYCWNARAHAIWPARS